MRASNHDKDYRGSLSQRVTWICRVFVNWRWRFCGSWGRRSLGLLLEFCRGNAVISRWICRMRFQEEFLWGVLGLSLLFGALYLNFRAHFLNFARFLNFSTRTTVVSLVCRLCVCCCQILLKWVFVGRRNYKFGLSSENLGVLLLFCCHNQSCCCSTTRSPAARTLKHLRRIPREIENKLYFFHIYWHTWPG